jgi:hypothetical protein
VQVAMRQARFRPLCVKAALIVGLGAPGCSEDTDGSGTNATTPDPPTGTTEQSSDTDDGSTSQSSAEQTCTDSTMCETGSFCAAHHTAGQTTPPDEGICVEECVPLEHVSLWCIDDAACCEGQCDEASGFCVASEGTDSSTTTDMGTTDTSSSTATDTGTASSTTTATDTTSTTTGTGTTTS